MSLFSLFVKAAHLKIEQVVACRLSWIKLTKRKGQTMKRLWSRCSKLKCWVQRRLELCRCSMCRPNLYGWMYDIRGKDTKSLCYQGRFTGYLISLLLYGSYRIAKLITAHCATPLTPASREQWSLSFTAKNERFSPFHLSLPWRLLDIMKHFWQFKERFSNRHGRKVTPVLKFS
jgi:hypothetical protein